MNKEDVQAILKTVVDPELGLDIWHLELIRDIKIEGNTVFITMTFTSPMCPYGPQLMQEIEQKIRAAGAEEVDFTITFSPPWQPSEEVRELLGLS
ncbi:metal-sulfur cluster assembly factor [Candidatus Woesearchaeota archaeon]|nr:MAG: metal-sulfur cluster assembly factor [Candidatus Woesearchaeota archaeon]